MIRPPTDPITILCVDDHALFRKGIAGVIADEEDLKLVGEAATGSDALRLYREHSPDVTLMDIRLPDMNGIDVIAAIRKESPNARIMVLTTYEGDVQALRSIKAGASAYLLKSTSHTELLQTLRAVHSGRRCLPERVATMLAEGAEARQLSKREVEVLRLIATGNSNRSVGEHLGLAEETIKIHVKSILAKLSANDRTHAVTLAIESGIIDEQLNRRPPGKQI